MSIRISRRNFMKTGALALAGAGGIAVMSQSVIDAKAAPLIQDEMHMEHGGNDAMPMIVGEVDHLQNGFLPSEILTAFDYSKVSSLENGQTLQEFEEEMVGMVAWQSHSAWENHQPRLDRNAYATATSA